MIIQIVRHDIRPERFDEARARILRLGQIMMQQPGFLSRQVGSEAGHPSRITTVTAWRDVTSFNAWEEARKAAPPPDVPSDQLYTHVDVSRLETFS